MLGLGRWRTAAPAAPAPPEERPSSTLPTIKCSNCNAEIEISRLADHLCMQTTEEPESYELPPPPPPPVKPTISRSETMDSFVASDRKSYGLLRPDRQAPPMIDAVAANQPFSRPGMGPITPVSDYGNPRSASPMTSGGGRRTPMRSATSPMPRPYSPPSPELNSNLDCAFPPWPTMGSRSNTPTGPRPKDKKQTDPMGSRLGPNNPMYAPVSPRLDGGANVLKRMDTISPGPFDSRKGSFDRRPSATTMDETRADNAQPTGEQRGSPAKSIHSRSRSVNSNHFRGSRGSKGSFGLPSGPKDGQNLPPPPRPPPLDYDDDDHSFEGIDKFLRRVRDEEPLPVPKSLNAGDRSNTFPMPAAQEHSAALPRRPSEPTTRSRAFSNATISSVYSSDSIEAAPVPPMPSLDNLHSFGAPRSGAPSSKLTPGPLNIAPKSPMERPMHTPSESVSSGGSMSGFDARSNSSVSSVPESDFGGPANFSRPRKGSNSIRDGLHSPITPGSPPKRIPFGTQPGLTRMNAPDTISLPSPPAIPATVEELPESPMDPAIQRGLISQQRPFRPSLSNGSGRPINPTAYPLPPALSPPEEVPSRPSPLAPFSAPPVSPPFAAQPPVAVQPRNALPPRKDSRAALVPQIPQIRQIPRMQSPSIPQSTPNESLQRKPTSGKKAKCRGCNEQIVGKSVKAADGRLTGRWHKECFTCKTCRQPFQTADFYVHNNFPYCEHHYHQMNNSLCQLCNRGIEGQYLETDKERKYHPRCFTCSHCRIPLKDDYFEFNGRPYCERHAQHAASQNSMLGTGTRRFPERRTTKLMMMM